MPKAKIPVEDRLDILELIARYAWALDIGDIDGYLACFTEDAYIDHGPQGRRHGHDGIKSTIDELWYSKPDHYLGRQHRMSQHIMTPDGADVRIKCFWSILQQRVTTGESFVFGLGTWDTVATKIDDDWKFKAVHVGIWRGRNVPWVGDARAGEVTAENSLPF
jgi:3-phenylpropionate/cinnamic acid dioxygenase small subunit